MQQISPRDAMTGLTSTPPSVFAMATPAGFTPFAMAQHLRRTSGDHALCFAQAIYKDAAWANDDWGAYWADVISLV